MQRNKADCPEIVNWNDIVKGPISRGYEGIHVHTSETVEVVPGKIAVLSVGISDDMESGQWRLVVVFRELKQIITLDTQSLYIGIREAKVEGKEIVVKWYTYEKHLKEFKSYTEHRWGDEEGSSSWEYVEERVEREKRISTIPK